MAVWYLIEIPLRFLPGAAVTLQNLEPDTNGGYRRINGFTKYDTNQVGGQFELVLGVQIYKDQVIAALERLFTK